MENELKRDFFRKFRKDVEEVKLTSNSNKLISVLNREFLGVKFYIKGIRFELVQNNKYYDEYGIYLSMGYEFDDKSCKFLKCTTQTQRDMFADLKYDVNSGVFMGILSLTYMHNIKDFNYLVSPKDGSELYILYYPNDENWEIISSQKNQERIIKMQQKIQKKLKKTRR
jgi:hypothetical protein